MSRSAKMAGQFKTAKIEVDMTRSARIAKIAKNCQNSGQNDNNQP